ncbi:MAG TPA: phage holin family protein [Hanamia sp.]|jgi:Zn-dependent protease with chaperone function|nr:phage holin family protein [Hanamia sp.]
MENKTTSVEELFHKLKEYGDTRLDLFKLKTINKASGYFSSIVMGVVLVVILLIVLTFISIGAALLIGSLLGKSFYGFFIIALIYLIIGLILYSSRKKIIKEPISNKLIKELMD